MDNIEQPQSVQPGVPAQAKSVLPAVIITAVITAVVVGAGTYFLMKDDGSMGPIVTDTPAPTVSTPVSQAFMSLTYPNGGEVLSLNQPVNIRYELSNDFREKLSADTLVELYLVRPDGVLEGYIGGITDYSKTNFIWDPQELQHWSGLDITFRPPQSGQYKVLLLARSKAPPPTQGGDFPVDIFVDGFDKFDGQKVLVVREGKILAQHDLVAKDISDSNFSIR